MIGHSLPDELVNNSDQSLIPAAYRELVPLHSAIKVLRKDEQFQKARDLYTMDFLPLYKRLKRMGKVKHQRTRTTHMILPTNL
jgi:hypothetical protein